MISFREGWEWLGGKTAWLVIATLLVIIVSAYYFYEGDYPRANYAMTLSVLLGTFVFLGVWYHREHVDGCSMGMGNCIRKQLLDVLDENVLKPEFRKNSVSI